ncbi:glycosyltransferase family 87 protein [Phenylobacterium sp.]|uniref:glycosyltransferase family 87 protein n=1 Tax=Phenylobacterium sp. TaxID=1871053 RepID=UPI0027377CA5|nr:glycosyltransferase family 87 protein [Phenylobacterium sp.]MDP3869337.1 glycosyltransferase family 87 protein [Phenylobacterium sp.]
MSLDFVRHARWLDRERAVGYAKILALAYVPLLVIPYLYAIGTQPGGRPSVDFMSFWSAGSLFWRDPASAYDAAAQIAFQAEAFQSHGRYLPFLYPPPFLALVAPLALIPFAVAYPTWMAATYAVYLASARRLLSAGAWPIAVFPALYINAVQGQTAALFAGLFVAAGLLMARRPFVAGLVFGCLIFKPQLGLLIPLALIAGGFWRTLLGAALSSLALLLLALIAFGPETYAAFVGAGSTSLGLLQEGSSLGWAKVQSLYGASRQIGAPPWAAIGLQGLLSLAAAGAVAWVWRSGADMLTRMAALATGALLATPYVLDYDFVLLIVPLCWLARRGLEAGFRPWEKLLLLAVYVTPLICRQAAIALGFNLMPLLVIGLLGLVTATTFREASAGEVRSAAR